MSKYDVNNNSVESLLSWIKTGEIAIPEIQRPFVWDATKVRDLIDSLYKGYPVGYIILWRSSNTKLKDGSKSYGKKILIDGQQRITALTAALLAQEVVDTDYRKKRIKISFNPKEEKFEVNNPAISKNKEWIADISEVNKCENMWEFQNNYITENNISPEYASQITNNISNLVSVKNRLIGVIELHHNLDIETVTEIFIRINSKGVVLSNADFAMSKIAVDEKHGGNFLRKAIDYFCHFIKSPADFENIKNNDKIFSDSSYFDVIKWSVNENLEIYQPEYKDLIRVAFTYKFNRGKISDLVSLLSGRNFETKEYTEDVVEDSFKKFTEGVLDCVNKTNFQRFMMIIKSIGIIDSSLIRSQNVLNFGYILYLKLRDMKVEPATIEKYVKKWTLYTILTSRYSSSPESMFDYDIKRIDENFQGYIENEMNNNLTDTFWEKVLVDKLETSVTSSPFFNLMVMSQIYFDHRGLFSKDIKIRQLIEHRGDIHHIFPKNYLKKNGINNRNKYNQIANYVYTQSEINIKIKDSAPNFYFSKAKDQCENGDLVFGGIVDKDDFLNNLEENSIPEGICDMTHEHYEEFLHERRKLLADQIKTMFYKV